MCLSPLLCPPGVTPSPNPSQVSPGRKIRTSSSLPSCRGWNRAQSQRAPLGRQAGLPAQGDGGVAARDLGWGLCSSPPPPFLRRKSGEREELRGPTLSSPPQVCSWGGGGAGGLGTLQFAQAASPSCFPAAGRWNTLVLLEEFRAPSGSSRGAFPAAPHSFAAGRDLLLLQARGELEREGLRQPPDMLLRPRCFGSGGQQRGSFQLCLVSLTEAGTAWKHLLSIN